MPPKEDEAKGLANPSVLITWHLKWEIWVKVGDDNPSAISIVNTATVDALNKKLITTFKKLGGCDPGELVVRAPEATLADSDPKDVKPAEFKQALDNSEATLAEVLKPDIASAKGKYRVYVELPAKPKREGGDIVGALAVVTEAIKAMREEAANVPRPVYVRWWTGPDVSLHRIKLSSSSFDDFNVRVVEEFPGSSKIYYFPKSFQMGDRVRIHNTPSWNEYLALPAPRPQIFIWGQEGSSHESADAIPGELKSVSEKSNRSGQSAFADAVKRTDEYKCVVCSATGNLEAAHHIPVSEKLDKFKLLAHMDANNGYSMCKDCHSLYDNSLFYIDGAATIIVSEALAAHNPKFAADHNNKQIEVSSRRQNGLMTQEMEEYRKKLFDSRRLKRHERDSE